MKKIYQAPEVEIIDLQAREQIAVIFEDPNRHNEVVGGGKQSVEDWD